MTCIKEKFYEHTREYDISAFEDSNSENVPPATFTGLAYSSMIQFFEFVARVFVHFLRGRRRTKNDASIQRDSR